MSLSRQKTLASIRSGQLDSGRCLVEQGTKPGQAIADERLRHDNDIDFWAAMSDRQSVAAFFAALDAIHLISTTHAGWAQHDVYAVPCSDGALLIDTKFGDLMVGPLLLLRETELLSSLDSNNRLAKEAVVADVLVRRLARGKPLDDERLHCAQSAWSAMSEDERVAARTVFTERLGEGASEGVQDLLEGRAPASSVGRTLRRRVYRGYLGSLSALRTAISRLVSKAIARLTRRAKPFGLYANGALVSISGTDGTGKSTTLENVAADLRRYGFRIKTVYLGRGRGNIPGVATLRDFVSRRVLKGRPAKDVYRKPAVNKGASWLYAFEYFLRTLWPRFLVRVLGYVVLCDRYCYDIALIPGASTSAVTLARVVCPKPAITVVLHAPAEVILARKAERSEEQIKQQQAVLAEIIEKHYARHVAMKIDTSVVGIDETRQQIVASICQLTHNN